MTPHMFSLLGTIKNELRLKGPVLEIGSYIEPVQAHLNLRSAFFPGWPVEMLHDAYIGIDCNPGIGVDIVADMLDRKAMLRLQRDIAPQVILCLYVLEHVWEIQAAAEMLGELWKQNPDAWMFIATHQNQPYHGYGNGKDALYDDYWRITRAGMRRLMDEAGIEGGRLFLAPDDSNPEDVMLVRQPASMVWPGEALERAWKYSGFTWHVRD